MTKSELLSFKDVVSLMWFCCSQLVRKMCLSRVELQAVYRAGVIPSVTAGKLLELAI
jgi:hypothetical protein